MPNHSNDTGITAPVFAMLCLLLSGTAQAVSLGQIDTFGDGLQGWRMGFSQTTADHMAIIADGGPDADADGIGDSYLQVNSDSTEPFGGRRLTFFNTDQWQGDYTAAGITAIAMDVKNFSPNEVLNLRLGINGGFVDSTGTSIIGGTFTTSIISLVSSPNWTRVVFSLLPGDLIASDVGKSSNTPGNDVQATLANVWELRLLNSATASWAGAPVTATLGVDNIQAVPLPPALALFASGLVVLLPRRRKQNLQS